MTKTPMTHTAFRPLAAGLAALVAIQMALAPPASAQEVPVERREVEDLKAVLATVESVRQAQARARVSGTVAELSVVEGDKVEGGRIVAMVVDQKLPLQMNALEARIRSAQAQAHQAEIELDRAQSLRASGTGSQQRLDDARTELTVARAQLAAYQAEREVLEQQLREGGVLAPSGGRVLKVHVVEGSVVMPGEPVVTMATDVYILRLRLPERHARFIREGDPVLVGARGLGPKQDEGPEVLSEGRVRQVYPELASGQVVADVEVKDLGDYFVGERTRVYVATGTRAALVVPRDYVYRRFGLEYVKLAQGGEVVVQTGQPVPALGGKAGGVEVLTGLKPGDTLVKP